MMQSLPLVLVPGLTCTARLYGPQVEALWPYGQMAVADHRRDDEIGAVAKRILDNAPPRFALAGPVLWAATSPSRCMRQAAGRMVKLALLDTSARPDTPEQIAGRKTQIGMAQGRPLWRNSRSVDPALFECKASARRTPHIARARTW